MSGGGGGGGGDGGGGAPATTVSEAPQVQGPMYDPLTMQALFGSPTNPGPATMQYKWAQDMMQQWQQAQSQPAPSDVANPSAKYTPAKVVYNPTTGGYDTVATAAQGGLMSLRR